MSPSARHWTLYRIRNRIEEPMRQHVASWTDFMNRWHSITASATDTLEAFLTEVHRLAGPRRVCLDGQEGRIIVPMNTKVAEFRSE